MSKTSVLWDERVICAEDYRAFLKESLRVLREKKRGFSLTTFARTSGLGSRGFILDVIKREKRLTPRSAPKVMKGLGLSGKMKSLFILLIEEGEADFSPVETHDRGAKIEKLRAQLLDELKQDQNKVSPDLIYSNINFILVYSALGSLESGASLEQICGRTGLSGRTVSAMLERMIAEKIVLLDGFNYKAINSHIVFEKLGDDQGFKNVFLEMLKVVRNQVTKSMKSDDKLFFHSTVPVEKSKLPQLKAALRSTMTEFVHENQCDEGDHVAMIQLAFF